MVLALAAHPALAATKISGDSTTAQTTSSTGDLTVADSGTLTVKSGAAVTVDSNNAVTNNGTITGGTGDSASAIYVNAGTTSTISNAGTISVLETYNPDATTTNVTASASDRYGIYVASGATSSGSISNSGTISVDGNDSGGIVLAGDYTGDVTQTEDGSIKVLGNNSVGISTQAVDGNVDIAGAITAIGEGTSDVAINGDVTGSVTLEGTITKSYSYTDDDGSTVVLGREALNAGTAAVSIAGSVDGGIYIPDGDDTDDNGNAGSIVNYGNGAALLIGGTSDTTIGGVVSDTGTYSLAIDGTVTSSSYYSQTDAYGVVIGGQGGNVTLTDGIGVSGTLTASTVDSSSTALLINSGSTVTSLYNEGTISAAVSAGGEGSATAIQDLSGTLTTVNNTGYIGATGTSGDTLTALDLSANTTGVTINQYLNSTDAATKASNEADGTTDTTVYASIVGDIHTGSGDDTINEETGLINGDTYFGTGSDTLNVSSDAEYEGDVYFGGTGTANLSDTATYTGTMDFAGNTGTVNISDSAKYTGSFSNAGNLTVNVDGGSLISDATGTVSFNTLNVTNGGTLAIYVDGDTGESSTYSLTNANLGDGTLISANISSLANAEGTYTVLTADNLTTTGTISSSVPYIFDGTVAVDGNSVDLTISRKTTAELGLTSSQASAWDAIYATAQNDDNMTSSLLDVEDQATLRKQVASMLPDHAGGIFDAVTQGTRLVSRPVGEDTNRFSISDVGGWLQPVYWRDSKSATGTASYKDSGWGITLGLEKKTKLGYFGVSYAYLSSTVKDNGGSQKLDLGQNDFGAFWRYDKGPLLAYARIGASKVSVDSTRTYTGTIDGTDFTESADGKWGGWLYSGLLGATYRAKVSTRFSLKPKVELEQFYLKERGYTETGDYDALNLTVDGRTSKSTTATTTVTASYSLGKISEDWRPLTFEFEGGRRSVLSGSLGDTTANFEDGDPFTIQADSLKGAWIGEARMLAGGYDFTWQLALRTEQGSDYSDYSLRAGLSIAF